MLKKIYVKIVFNWYAEFQCPINWTCKFWQFFLEFFFKFFFIDYLDHLNTDNVKEVQKNMPQHAWASGGYIKL